MTMNKSDVQKQVEESNYEARRKKRIIVFNMQEKEEKTDREQVLDMIGDMGVRVREEEVVDVVRRRESGWQDQLLSSLKVNMINGLC